MKKQFFSVVIALVVAVVLILYLFAFQVRETEIGIRSTFGKPDASGVKREAALYWKLPWPVQKVEKFDKRLQTFNDRLEETLTRDKKNVLVTACVGWRIGDASLSSAAGRDPALIFRESIGNMDDAKDKLTSLIGDRKTRVVGRYDLNNFVSTDAKQMLFEEIEQKMLDEVRTDALRSYGIDVTLFRIVRLELPSSTLTAVYNRMNAERNREVVSFRAKGEARANTIKAQADAERAMIVAQGLREGERIRGEGEKQVAAASEIFHQYPDLARWLRSVRTLEDVTKERTTVIMDGRNEMIQAITKDIDLEKLGNPAVPAPAAAPAGSSAPAAAPAAAGPAPAAAASSGAAGFVATEKERS